MRNFKKVPLKKGKVSGPSLPGTLSSQKSNESGKKERKLYPVFKNGRMCYYDSVTGERVKEETLSRHEIEAYNPDKVEILLTDLSNGIPFHKCLKRINISYSTYVFWRKSVPELQLNVAKARNLRSETLNESLFSSDLSPLLSIPVAEMSATQAALYEKRMKMLALKQKALKSFKVNEVLNNEGSGQAGMINPSMNITIEIPEKLVNLVEKNFRPVKKGENLELPSPNQEVLDFEKELMEKAF